MEAKGNRSACCEDAYRVAQVGKLHEDEANTGGIRGWALLRGLRDHDARQRPILGLQLAGDIIHDVTVLLWVQQLLTCHLHVAGPPCHSHLAELADLTELCEAQHGGDNTGNGC